MASLFLRIINRDAHVALIKMRPFKVPPQTRLSPLLAQKLNMLRADLQRVLVSPRPFPTPALDLTSLVSDLLEGLPQNLKIWVNACLAACSSLPSDFAGIIVSSNRRLQV